MPATSWSLVMVSPVINTLPSSVTPLRPPRARGRGVVMIHSAVPAMFISHEDKMLAPSSQPPHTRFTWTMIFMILCDTLWYQPSDSPCLWTEHTHAPVCQCWGCPGPPATHWHRTWRLEHEGWSRPRSGGRSHPRQWCRRSWNMMIMRLKREMSLTSCCAADQISTHWLQCPAPSQCSTHCPSPPPAPAPGHSSSWCDHSSSLSAQHQSSTLHHSEWDMSCWLLPPSLHRSCYHSREAMWGMWSCVGYRWT